MVKLNVPVMSETGMNIDWVRSEHGMNIGPWLIARRCRAFRGDYIGGGALPRGF